MSTIDGTLSIMSAIFKGIKGEPIAMIRGLRSILVGSILSLLVSACQGPVAQSEKYNLPKYVPVGQVSISYEGIHPRSTEGCNILLVDLIGAWVTAGAPEKDPFPFTDTQGNTCQGTFDTDILPSFTQSNFWYTGALSCRTCHGPDINVSYARLDMSSYQGILAGSSRASEDSKGEDILGGFNWQESTLNEVLSKGEMPPNQPKGVSPMGPLVSAGIHK